MTIMAMAINKKIFLNTLQCPTYGWLQLHNPTEQLTSPSEQLRLEEGLEIHNRARTLYPDGVMVSGSNETCVQKTQQLLSNPKVSTIFEATFQNGQFITKADVLIRNNSSWKIIEIKSNVNESQELIDDLAYTTFVAQSSGLEISSCSLLLISKDYRMGMPNEKLFIEIDPSREVSIRANEFCELSDEIAQILSSDEKPAHELRWECKKCDVFEECCCETIENHIFDLPMLSHTRFCQLNDIGIDRIEDIPEDFELTDHQSRVRDAVVCGEPLIDREGLMNALDSIVFPCYYLDFETVLTAIPLYEGIAPYRQIPTQYSLHICSGIGKVDEHREYLADPPRDCRREFAERLIEDCGSQGSIVVYASFEKTIIRGLVEIFPDLAKQLEALTNRLADLHSVIRKFLYHPDFHGSYSIKKILPVLVPELSYEDMEIDNGLQATAAFADMARGKYSVVEAEVVRKQLLEYCSLDTFGMVKLHEQLLRHNTNLWLLGMGWVPLLYADADFPSKLIDMCKGMKRSEAEIYVDKMICQYHTGKLINKILKGWDRRPCMSQRIHILKLALQAHTEGKYVLSVPSILPQIEGVVAENFGHRGYMGSRQHIMYLEQLLKNDSFENTEEVFLKFITDIILSSFEHGDPMFSFLSRHAILHGADTSYGKESISLRTILVLDILTRKFEFVAFDNSNVFHRPNCSLVKHSKEKRTFYTYEFQAEMEGMTSCKSCI